MSTRLSLLLILLALTLAACSPGVDLDSPPELVVGQDVCDECGMIISDARFAASYVTDTGDVRRFDDIGGMFAYTQKHDDIVHMFWVHDYHSEEWIDAEKAQFVLSPDLQTPMAWGLAAFADAADAEAFVASNGGSMTTLAALQEAVASGALDPESLSSHLHGEHEMEMEHNMDEMEEIGGN